MLISRPVTIFRFFGFQIKADSSWIFISILIAWTLMTNVFPVDFPGYDVSTYRHMAVWSLVGLIVSILAHELAHAVIAEYYDMPILSIRLFIFGGVAEMKGQPSHPKGEFMMAIAGPIMSFLMGLFFSATAWVWAMYFSVGPVSQTLYYLGYINYLLAFFNMVPAFPLDGGRALRALIWGYKRNLVIATRWASDLGEIFAYVLIAYGCYRLTFYNDIVGALWLGLLGIFMLGAGKYAVRQTESWSLLAGQTVRDFMKNDYISVSPDLTLADFVDQYVYKHYQQNFPVVDHGRLVGMISVQAIMELDRKKWSWTHIRSQMIPVGRLDTVSPMTSASEVLDSMQRLSQPMLLVTTNKQLVGIININDIVNYLTILQKLDQPRIVGNSSH